MPRARTSANLCSCCRVAKPKAGYRTCEACLEAQRKRQRRRRRAFKRAGLCARCGQSPPTPGTNQCDACRQAQHEAHIERWENRILDGICPQCGIRPAARNRRLCTKCQRAQRERKRATGYTYDPTVAERVAGWKLCQRAAGRCIACGIATEINPATGKSYAMCAVHRIAAAQARLRRKRGTR